LVGGEGCFTVSGGERGGARGVRGLVGGVATAAVRYTT